MKAQISTIPDSEMDARALAADLAWRGIRFPRCTQQDSRPTVPVAFFVDQGYWGVKNGFETELEKTLHS